ncbi:MAG: hypothetical protein KatS3mg058_4284 [Roseiflexus sp.]|nr:MAG: hypothetical protein KatS3mg058_4284 [Roseiflexus sp.]
MVAGLARYQIHIDALLPVMHPTRQFRQQRIAVSHKAIAFIRSPP